MAEIHGQLLIGGLRLKGVHGTLQHESPLGTPACWSGELLVDCEQGNLLETSRPYRLELDDGRAGQVIVARVELVPGQPRVKVLYQGTSELQSSLHGQPDERSALEES